MGLFDENEKIETLDKEVIEACNQKNRQAVSIFEGWTSKDKMSYVMTKDGSLRSVPPSATYDLRLTSKRGVYNGYNAKSISLEISSLSQYKDKDGLMHFKINRPSLPVVIRRDMEIPDCFIFDVPEGTKEVTFITFRAVPLAKLPKVKGNVKVNYINRNTCICIRPNEKINISKWWNGDYESVVINGNKVIKK